MITRKFVTSGDTVSFLWPGDNNQWEAVHGIVERVFPNGDFVVVDEKGLTPKRFAYAAMAKAKKFATSIGRGNPMHRYGIGELCLDLQ